MDPKTESMENISPYASNLNDPIRLKDPNGDCPACAAIIVEAAPIPVVGEVVVGGALIVGTAVTTAEAAESFSDWLGQKFPNGILGGGLQLGPVPFYDPYIKPANTGTTSTSTTDLSGNNPSAGKPLIDVLIKPGSSGLQAKGTTQTAPGQTAGGHPTDVYGNKLGPSGKPQVNNVYHPSQKAAKDAARQEGDGAPVKHPSPTKGEPHYHPTRGGEKIPNSTHHNY